METSLPAISEGFKSLDRKSEIAWRKQNEKMDDTENDLHRNAGGSGRGTDVPGDIDSLYASLL